ncbi:MAG: dihydrofolate reductase [Treponema sp.]|jgi:dihydrofolate reductase|nr:dihydrofolate reductase [Treponema sp.]
MIPNQEIIIIAAMAENRIIGNNNSLPWSVKGNLAHFKNKTMGWPCIMGRKTWESLPVKPLPGRLNIIVSNTLEEISDDNILVFSSLSSAVEYCASHKKVFICGGESIYRQALPLANKIDLTLIPGFYDGDAYFPKIDSINWEKTDVIDMEKFSIITYIKTNTNKME